MTPNIMWFNKPPNLLTFTHSWLWWNQEHRTQNWAGEVFLASASIVTFVHYKLNWGFTNKTTSENRVVDWCLVSIPTCQHFKMVANAACWYTCQLFLGQRCEIFILRVPGFPKTIRQCPKFSEDVWSIPKTFRTSPDPSAWTCFAKHDLVPNAFFRQNSVISGKVSPFTHLTWSFIFSHWFEITFFGKCVVFGCNNSHFSTRREKLVRKRELAWDQSFQLVGVRLTPKAWELAGIQLWQKYLHIGGTVQH